MTATCAGCGGPTIGRRLRCAACKRLHKRAVQKASRLANLAHYRAKARAYYSTPEGAKAVLESRYRWLERNRERQRANQRAHYHRNAAIGITAYRVRNGLVLPSAIKAEARRADYSAIASLVPQTIAGREDVIQDLALAIIEGRVTFAELQADRSLIRKFTGAHRSASFEMGGYAVSLDQPMRSGQSWHDILSAETACAGA